MMYTSDSRMLALMELLRFQKGMLQKDFCLSIGFTPNNVPKVKRGEQHFTQAHIEAACRIYNVNANWVFGVEKKVFRSAESLEITDFTRFTLPTR